MARFSSGNVTCPAAPTSEAPVPIVGSLTSRHLITWIALGLTALTLAISLLNIFRHLFRYSCPAEQRHIVRILFTPVVFSVLSLLSIILYSGAKYLLPVQVIYENFALAAVFLLLVNYIAPDEHIRAAYFEQLGSPPKKGETQPGGGGFAWFKRIWIAIFLNAVAGAILGIAEVASQAAGTYCETSNNVHFAHIWIRILTTAFLAMAVLGILRFAKRFGKDMAGRKLVLKLVSFKAIVFLSTVQTLIISFLTGSHGGIKGNHKITFLDDTIGIPGLLVCVEQVLFSILMFVAYDTQEYKSGGSSFQQKKSFPSAAIDALNPADLIHGIAVSASYLLGRTSYPKGAEYANLNGTKYQGQEIPLGSMPSPTGYVPQAFHPSHQEQPLTNYARPGESYGSSLPQAFPYQGRG